MSGILVTGLKRFYSFAILLQQRCLDPACRQVKADLPTEGWTGRREGRPDRFEILKLWIGFVQYLA